MKPSSHPLTHVCYDLTRLVERMDAGHPTGVDRVDLNYALWTQSRAERWQGLVQTASGVELLDAAFSEDLLRRLRERWLEGGAAPAGDSLERPNGWAPDARRALKEKLGRCGLATVWRERGLSGLFLRVCPSASGPRAGAGVQAFSDADGRATYWNIGHCFRFERCLHQLGETFAGRSVIFLHDIIPLTHPETQRPSSQAHFARFVAWIQQCSGQVLMSSESTVESLQGIVGGMPRVAALPLAVEGRFFNPGIKKAGPENSPYFLCVGTLEPRKNVDLLLEVWERFHRVGEVPAKLILVGRPTRLEKGQKTRIRFLRTTGAVDLLTGVDDARLLDLMAGAKALLFPSLVEGWGMPLSEALAMGLPVLASDIPVFREVGQGVPEYLDPREPADWEAMIRACLEPDEGCLRAQAQRLIHYRPVTWSDHFQRLEAVLGSLDSGG